MRQQPISMQRARQVQSLFPTALCEASSTRGRQKNSGANDESETNLELLSKDDEIVDIKGSTNSVYGSGLAI